ncbi:MAG: dihydroorotase [Gammaproteobacteria bacterium]
MSNASLLIKNAVVVSDGSSSDGDVLIRRGRIEQVAASISADGADEIIDANGRYLLPGMIDDQVHFREPGLTKKGDIATESAAAVAGGITSYMEMPNVSPPTTTRKALQEKYNRAAGRSVANYAFYLGATNNNIDEICELKAGEACGVKAFMGASTGDMLVDDIDALHKLFARSPLLIATHCEDTPTIKANEQAAREKYGDQIPMAEHPHIRSAEACYKSSELAVGLAREHGSRLHVLHLTTARELELFSAGPLADKKITAEACVHHLMLDDGDYEALGTLIKCNPAIKTAADREALVQAVIEDRIDVIATDHAPHLLEEKEADSYFKTPAGLPLVQHALVMALEHVHSGRMSIEHIVRKVSHAPAELFGVRDRGYIREGYWADLVLVDMQKPTRVERDNVLYKCGWSPFEGRSFGSRVLVTLVNGAVVCNDGVPTGDVSGERLEFV